MSDKENEKIGEKSFLKELFSWIGCIVGAFAVAITIKYFIFTPTLVQQRSMTPTILDGERVIINRLVRTFRMPIYRGDIITFEKPDATKDDGTTYYNSHDGLLNFFLHDLLEVTKVSYIKRVIGVPGDHVVIKNNGEVYVNETKLNEVYLPEDTDTPITGPYYDVEVPEGYIFVMGDNRGGSSDSREFGFIPLEKVEGRVTYRIWPLSKIGKIEQ